MPIAISKLERFFREVGGVDVDKSDLRRYETFVNRKIHDLLVRGEAVALANGRELVERIDVPVTKGLQESIDRFEEVAAASPVRSAIEQIVGLPQLDLACDEELAAQLPDLAGGVSVALARAFRILDPEVKNPSTEHWERAFRLFDLLI